jgi:DNA-binding LytR/AlgR family response regulator
MIKCLVIDDEQEAIDSISDYLSSIPQLSLQKTFTRPLEALNYLEKSKIVDLIFMDIDMPLLNGIELSELIRHKADKLVFTTSHSKYALDAFKVRADDFLLKPFSFSDLLKTMKKLFPENETESPKMEKDDDFIYVKSKEDHLKLIKVDFDDIIAIESLLNYVRIHTITDKLVTHISLKEAKEALSERDEFIQLHRSFIISNKHISVISGNTLTMSSGAKFTIGDSYRDILNEFLAKKMLKPAAKK